MKKNEINNTLKKNIYNSTKGLTSIQGISEIQTKNGEALFSPAKIFAQPNSEVFFKALTSSISRYYNEFFEFQNNSFSDFNLNNNYIYLFSVVFRDCVIGEIFIENINRFFKYKNFKQNCFIDFFSCSKCPTGSFSLSNPYSSIQCHSCPQHAFCPGGSEINLEPGYWRESNVSQEIVDCSKFSDFCL